MPITSYDPLVPPSAEAWLALDEDERLALVEDYHRNSGIRLPNLGVHATLQAVVETQVAMGDETPVARTILRLMSEGLDRHEALHCVGRALIETMNEAARAVREGTAGDVNGPYFRKVETLTAHGWRESNEPDPASPPGRRRRQRPRLRFRP